MGKRRVDRDVRRMTPAGIMRFCPDCNEWLPETRVYWYYQKCPDGVLRARTYCRQHEKDRVRLNYRQRMAALGKPQRKKGQGPSIPKELLDFVAP